ncbi:hypothetical protein [Flavobacterium cellulosilyticum]|uniref:Uncharacterized protein n=1 Tax=Flavobacterium cellulosilyticum TaxID=2541731 RepID=A0A4R5CL64_9FLAO|nr:hypothetical protein [Flavobacterium cellulosilyticum]TDD99370.1 hypothetical protein E0F76_01185 [Flavobacterium cellulosilyticum]
MKKFASLFLIVTLFYNVLGFYMMFADQKEQSWVTAMEKTDDSKFEIFEINIKPYAYIVDSGFEEKNEDIIINNTTYHVFKNRIQNNVLKLYCIKNIHKAAINKDLKKIVDSQLFETNSNKENPTKKLLKSFIKDYIPNDEVCYDFNLKNGFKDSVSSNLPNKRIHSGHLFINLPPPDFI